MERLVWIGPVRHIGGYGEVARNYLRGLIEIGAPVVAVDGHGQKGDPEDLGLPDVQVTLDGPVQSAGATCVYHASPDDLPRLLSLHPMDGAARRVACTIAETDRLPKSWVQNLAPFDEVWVPTTFQKETFTVSGVPRERIVIVPYGVDTSFYSPTARPANERFRFLYVFALDWRKGFDLLLESYLSEFSREEPVDLVLKVLAPNPGPANRGELVRSIADRVDLFSPNLPRVEVIDEHMSRRDLLDLVRSADLYVSTDRANGWGMPCHEAMAAGTPTATIDWSGSTEFMHEGNALLIPPGPLEPIDPRLSAARPDYADQRWPYVDAGSVRSVLRTAFENRDRLRELADAARDEVLRERDLAAAARAIVQRHDTPYRPRPGLLDKVLRGLEQKGPSDLIEGSRSRIFLHDFAPGESTWRDPLRDFLARHEADDDVTFCLWVDSDHQNVLDDVAQEITDHVESQGGFNDTADIQLVVAPRDHIPWDRVLTPA